MAVTVLIRDGGQTGELRLTLDAPRVVIGRGKSCDIQLPDASVSLRHASIRQQGGRNLIVDEGSTNGVVVRSAQADARKSAAVRLPPHTPHTLADGDLVRVGKLWLEVRFAAGVPSAAADVRALAREVLQAALVAAGEAAGAELATAAGARLPLANPSREYVVGRAADADLVLGEEAASRRHAAIARAGDGWHIRDLGSKRGTLLDGQPVSDKGAKLADGAVVTIGATELRFSDPLETALEEVRAAADVKMKPEELAAPPPGMEVAAVIEAPGGEPEAPEGEPSEEHEEEEDELSEPSRGALVRLGEEPPQGGFGAVDAFVILIALGLLGLSALGLVYVLG
jgi:pSer/pThr/pTyr-binding forkhead associated (FHA) protein